MKKSALLSLVLAVCLVVSACSGTPAANSPTPGVTGGAVLTPAPEGSTPPAETAPAETTPAPEEPSSIDPTPEVEAMLPIMDSLLLCMSENGLTYDPASPAFVYDALYYAVVLYGNMHPLGALDGGAFRLPLPGGQEFATALFAAYTDLDLAYLAEHPELGVSYDESTEELVFSMSDRSSTESRMEACHELSDGSGLYEVTVGLYSTDDGSLFARARFVLGENSYLSGITDPMFPYAVVSAEML